MFDTFLIFIFHETFNNCTTLAVFNMASLFNGDVSKWNVGVVTNLSDSKHNSFTF